MEELERLKRSKTLTVILDENFSPVGRMRLFSQGVRPNNRLVRYEEAVGDKGCLTCGNCVDACPVVREKERFEFRSNRRTSMSLENIVEDECRRCYRCVRACPQVTPGVKEYATGFRRAEKFIHASLATLIFTLMGTGIFLYHYKMHIPELHAGIYGVVHNLAGILLIVLPVVYYLIDKNHFRRLIDGAWEKPLGTGEWFRQLKAFLRHPFRDALPAWTEFNPYHKFWIRYLCCALPLLALTGIGNFFGEAALGKSLYGACSVLHSLIALCTDLLILLHLYFKLLRFLCRNIGDMFRNWRSRGDFHYPFLYARKEVASAQGGHEQPSH